MAWTSWQLMMRSSEVSDISISVVLGRVDPALNLLPSSSGMIFALSRRILPGAPYSPSRPPPHRSGPRSNLSPNDLPASSDSSSPLYEGRWRLDECLRFATEIAGRRMRRRDAAGLALAMERVGWGL